MLTGELSSSGDCKLRLDGPYSEANRLYGTSSDVGFMHPFMNPLVLYFARTLVRVSSPVCLPFSHKVAEP